MAMWITAAPAASPLQRPPTHMGRSGRHRGHLPSVRAKRKTWTSDLVWLTQTARSFGAAQPTRRPAIMAPADRVEARPRRGVRTRR